MPKVNKIDHICMCVKDLEAAKKMWEPILGKEGPDDPYEDAPSKIRVARYWIGDVGFELMEDMDGTGDVAKWIERHGESVNIIGFNVDSTPEAVEDLKEKGYQIIKFGEYGELIPFRDCQYSFVHPKQTNGILVEMIDYKWEELKK